MTFQIAEQPNIALCSNRTRFATALCPPKETAQLLPYNHYTVQVNGRTGVLVTYPDLKETELTQPVELQIVFEHIAGHPAAPQEVQSIINNLTFDTIS